MHGLNTLIKHQTLDRFSQLSFKASKSRSNVVMANLNKKN
jgi:hypothetical protein